MSNAKDTEWMDGLTDSRCETIIPPFNYIEAGVQRPIDSPRNGLDYKMRMAIYETLIMSNFNRCPLTCMPTSKPSLKELFTHSGTFGGNHVMMFVFFKYQLSVLS